MSACATVIDITTATAERAPCGFPAPNSFETLVLHSQKQKKEKIYM